LDNVVTLYHKGTMYRRVNYNWVAECTGLILRIGVNQEFA
jgi:hypothetical protein